MIKPKFALIPSGYKSGVWPTTDGKVYSVIPNETSGDFDFERNGGGYRVNEDNLLEQVSSNTPRLCHLKQYSCPFIWLENSVSNYLVWSENYTISNWTAVSTTVTLNDTISPTGEMNASKLSSSNNYAWLQQGLSISQNQFCSASIFVKKGSGNTVGLEVHHSTSGTQGKIIYNFNTDTITPSGDGILHSEAIHYNDNWIRIGFTFQAESDVSGGTTLYKVWADNTSVLGTDVYIFGGQFEKNVQRISSYVYTDYSIRSQSQEILDGADLDTYDGTKGTLFLDFVPFGNNSTYASPSILFNWSTAGSSPNNFRFASKLNSSQESYLEISAFKPYSNVYSHSIFENLNTRKKIALTYYQYSVVGTVYKTYVNGELVDTGYDYSGTPPANIDEIIFKDTSSSNNFNGQVFDVRYYDENLSEANAKELTKL